MSSTVLGPGDRAVNKADEVFAFKELTPQWGCGHEAKLVPHSVR